ncbi:Putative intracellular protease/amidase [Chitinophaga costaii]|uniref:Putative intracellular protease/amidase n=1 Tax=Chitinophaga costaii TaxID=1335309 RepID=A0A1C4DSY6_9BACT|nr:DJ-1/PfpI family protein [Chitinophaga costaii]PUZ27775.1 hypothetical protein DCM91_06095 [Chitinophaga costaii]SCC34453.1 Putative intracellular protease/amidase [Chitinophaga costaii]
MEKRRNCYVLVYKGYADWQPALSMYGLHQCTDLAVTIFSIDSGPVSSAANLSITPYTFLDALHPESIDLLILPGGIALQQHDPALHGILQLLQYMIQQPQPACSEPSTLLVRSGRLEQGTHTSHALPSLPIAAPEHGTACRFLAAYAVDDGNVITVSNTQPVAVEENSSHHFSLMENKDFRCWFGCFHAAGTPLLEKAAPFYPTALR